MKKFDVWDYIHVVGREETQWVKAEEAKALEQLNKEMLEVLKRLKSNLVLENSSVVHTEVFKQLQSIIAKAEEL